MSQVDILTYSSILFWAISSIILVYFLIFSYILPGVIGTFRVRLFLMNELIVVLKKNFYFSRAVQQIYHGLTLDSVVVLLIDVLQIYRVYAVYIVIAIFTLLDFLHQGV